MQIYTADVGDPADYGLSPATAAVVDIVELTISPSWEDQPVQIAKSVQRGYGRASGNNHIMPIKAVAFGGLGPHISEVNYPLRRFDNFIYYTAESTSIGAITLASHKGKSLRLYFSGDIILPSPSAYVPLSGAVASLVNSYVYPSTATGLFIYGSGFIGAIPVGTVSDIHPKWSPFFIPSLSRQISASHNIASDQFQSVNFFLSNNLIIDRDGHIFATAHMSSSGGTPPLWGHGEIWIRNQSTDRDMEDVTIEVRCYDIDGALLDTITYSIGTLSTESEETIAAAGESALDPDTYRFQIVATTSTSFPTFITSTQSPLMLSNFNLAMPSTFDAYILPSFLYDTGLTV